MPLHAIVDIHHATHAYERWLRRQTRVVASELRDKHAQMRDDLYAFLRGTFYRWTQCFPAAVPDVNDAPHVIAVGDLHADSFGTWRDQEGRLAWGVDDFDDAYPLPYTNDLVRLATSMKIARDARLIEMKLRRACDTIVDGYESTLRDGGCPIVFAEEHEHLEKLGIEVIKPPRSFWRTLEDRPPARSVPRDARSALEALLPRHDHPRIARREAGLGSLGQPRYALIAESEGGAIAREVKALIPSSCVWATGRQSRGQPYYERAMSHATRSHDPFQRVIGKWIVRRLSPDSNPIELTTLSAKRDEHQLIHAMGVEAANVHLGSRTRTKAIMRDLRRRPSGWLHAAAKTMAKLVKDEWKVYRLEGR